MEKRRIQVKMKLIVESLIMDQKNIFYMEIYFYHTVFGNLMDFYRDFCLLSGD